MQTFPNENFRDTFNDESDVLNQVVRMDIVGPFLIT